MATNAITIAALLAKAADVHPRVVGQPTDDYIYKMEETLGPILHNAKYDMIVVPGIVSHNLVGLFQPIATYVDTWNAAFVIPTRPAPYYTTIDDNATSVVRNRMEAKHNNLRADYKDFEAAEKGALDTSRGLPLTVLSTHSILLSPLLQMGFVYRGNQRGSQWVLGRMGYLGRCHLDVTLSGSG